MSKPLIFYMAKIKKAYPQLTNLTIKEYDEIAQTIKNDLAANKPTSAGLSALYCKLQAELLYLARYYAENGIDESNFDDKLSSLYLALMKKYQKRYNSGVWYKDYNNFIASTYKNLKAYVHNANEPSTPATEQMTDEISDLSELDKFIKSKKFGIINEHLEEINKTLTERELRIISYYYGLNGSKRLNLRQIAETENLSITTICKIINKALKKIKKHPKFIQMSERL